MRTYTNVLLALQVHIKYKCSPLLFTGAVFTCEGVWYPDDFEAQILV